MLPTNPLLKATAPAGPHLPLATLRQYAAGTLAPAAQHRVEAHTLACPRCADILEGLLQTPPATTDQALAQLQQRLRHRVQQVEAAGPAARPRRSHRWLAPQLAAAATLLFGLVAGGWYTWQQRHTEPPHPPTAAIRPVAAPAPSASVSSAPVASAVQASPPNLAKARVATRGQGLQKMHRSSPQPTAELQPAPAAPASASAPVAVAAPDSVKPEAREAGVASAAGRVASSPPASDSSVLARRTEEVVIKRKSMVAEAAPQRGLMPAAPAVPPTPAGGYPAWREKIRHEAAEFKPEPAEQPLSGAVQLRLLIGADGKIQEIRVLHGLRADYDEEAQRLVCDEPAWIPGIGGGRRAAQVVDVAVPF